MFIARIQLHSYLCKWLNYFCCCCNILGYFLINQDLVFIYLLCIHMLSFVDFCINSGDIWHITSVHFWPTPHHYQKTLQKNRIRSISVCFLEKYLYPVTIMMLAEMHWPLNIQSWDLDKNEFFSESVLLLSMHLDFVNVLHDL